MRGHMNVILDGYREKFGETPSAQAFRLFMDKNIDLSGRRNFAGHLTGSALVWHKLTKCVLRVHHASVDRWVFSAGGHIEAGEYPWQAAIRELKEEIGISATPVWEEQLPIPFILDAQPIPASLKKDEPAHWHYDMIYLFTVDKRPYINSDTSEVKAHSWVPIAEVTDGNSPVDLRRHLRDFFSAEQPLAPE
jgi:8-oxo-dGTP pyrophosphatase MutT (NUDIX family)